LSTPAELWVVRSNSNQGNEEKNPCLTKCPSVLELEVVPELQSPVLKINSVPELATACLRKIKKMFQYVTQRNSLHRPGFDCSRTDYCVKIKIGTSMPWRGGIVVIASVSRTEDPGFESRQCERFLGYMYTLQCCCQNLI
jgi:hypothetical protein